MPCAQLRSAPGSRVYVAALPLVGMEVLEELCKRLGRTLPTSLALHRVILVQQPNDQAQSPLQRLSGP